MQARAGSYELHIALPAPGLLIIGEAWVPGWQAWVNDVPAEVLRANAALLGIPLPAGSHRVEVRYEPPAFALGLAITLGTLAACVVSGWRLRARWRGHALQR
jgi:uncharacterized membrane protein YfhO